MGIQNQNILKGVKMKFTCEKEIIVKEISRAYDIISNKNIFTTLSGVLLEVDENILIIKSTDLNISFISKIDVESTESGQAIIFCERFLAILKSMPEGKIQFEKKETNLSVKSCVKKVRFSLVLDIGKFPSIPIEDDLEKSFKVLIKDFREMIEMTIFSILDDSSRYYLFGAYFEKQKEKIIMVTTDGKRLSYIDKKIGDECEHEGIIIPLKTLCILKKLLFEMDYVNDIIIFVGKNKIYFRIDNIQILSSLIEGKFPDYESIISKSNDNIYEVILDRNKLKESINRVSLIDFYKNNKIFFNFEKDKLNISATEEIGESDEDIECNNNGESMLIFNYDYLLEPLSAMKSDKTHIEFSKVKGVPILLKPDKKNTPIYIIMPMRMGDKK